MMSLGQLHKHEEPLAQAHLTIGSELENRQHGQIGGKSVDTENTIFLVTYTNT